MHWRWFDNAAHERGQRQRSDDDCDAEQQPGHALHASEAFKQSLGAQPVDFSIQSGVDPTGAVPLESSAVASFPPSNSTSRLSRWSGCQARATR